MKRLLKQHPFLTHQILTKTFCGSGIHALQIGQGKTRVLLTAGHHANEYITSMLCMDAAERYLRAYTQVSSFGDYDADFLFRNATLYLVPMVNPDGIDLVLGALSEDTPAYRAAQHIAMQHPDIPFPLGWKANLRGVDLNLNYPAGWENAKKIKAALGFSSPAPRDFPGLCPLDQPESAALCAYTQRIQPHLVLALHTQGRVIYHTYGGICLPIADRLAEDFCAVSGYQLEAVPPESAYAGFKDWFLSQFHRPGFTIEAGSGVNPLPMEQFPQMAEEISAILSVALAQPQSCFL